jgi:hypothetical protein
MNILFVILILLTGIIGAWFHFLQVQKRADISGFFEYFFVNNTAGSKSAVVGFIAAMQTAYLAGVFNGLSVDAMFAAFQAWQVYPPLITVLYAAFGTGYTCDSMLNSWSPRDVKPQAAPVAATESTISQGS